MDHMKKFWDEEMALVREAARMQKIHLSSHVDQRMRQRNLSAYDIMVVLLTGRIVEGYDIGQYPNYRNPDPLRVFAGEHEGKKIAVGVALGQRHVTITTCYLIQPGSRFYPLFLKGGQ